jgi:hypothetical protein
MENKYVGNIEGGKYVRQEIWEILKVGNMGKIEGEKYGKYGKYGTWEILSTWGKYAGKQVLNMRKCRGTHEKYWGDTGNMKV